MQPDKKTRSTPEVDFIVNVVSLVTDYTYIYIPISQSITVQFGEGSKEKAS